MWLVLDRHVVHVHPVAGMSILSILPIFPAASNATLIQLALSVISARCISISTTTITTATAAAIIARSRGRGRRLSAFGEEGTQRDRHAVTAANDLGANLCVRMQIVVIAEAHGDRRRAEAHAQLDARVAE